MSGNTYADANEDSDRNGLRQQSNNEQSDTQQPSDNTNENAVILMNKVITNPNDKSKMPILMKTQPF